MVLIYRLGGKDQCSQVSPVRFTENQMSVLKQSFANDPYPMEETLTELSQQLGLTNKQVKGWHQRQRKKLRKGLLTSILTKQLMENHEKQKKCTQNIVR